LRKIAVISIITILYGCGTITPGHDTTQTSNWKIHQASIFSHNRWQAVAKMSVQSPQYSGSVRLDWKQLDENFSIILAGPLGLQNILMTGDSDEAVIHYKGKSKVGSPNLLIKEIIGIPLQISALAYWLRGIPSPNLIQTNLLIHPEGQAHKFEQAGWSLEFDKYKPTPFGSMPKKILGSNKERSFKLIISQWSKIKI
jgi:outer membrane lipoprotein LolB|tara:strand:+ start:14205 stop:14798 length:594 start_codon:yes stop_codon:yes gene_type:complete